MSDPVAHHRDFDELFGLFGAGLLKPPISGVLPLSSAPEALRSMSERRSLAKVVLRMRESDP